MGVGKKYSKEKMFKRKKCLEEKRKKFKGSRHVRQGREYLHSASQQMGTHFSEKKYTQKKKRFKRKNVWKKKEKFLKGVAMYGRDDNISIPPPNKWELIFLKKIYSKEKKV